MLHTPWLGLNVEVWRRQGESDLYLICQGEETKKRSDGEDRRGGYWAGAGIELQTNLREVLLRPEKALLKVHNWQLRI